MILSEQIQEMMRFLLLVMSEMMYFRI